MERSADKILSDSLEAIVGAIYLDGGLKYSEKFVLSFWQNNIDESVITLVDSKTRLQEYSLKKFKKLPKYTFLKNQALNINHSLKQRLKYMDQRKLLARELLKKMHNKMLQQN